MVVKRRVKCEDSHDCKVEDADDSSAVPAVRRLVLTIAGEENVERPVDDEITIVARTPNTTEAATWPQRIA